MSVTKVTDAMRNVTQVDAAKITTGTIPDARISASSVNAHVDLTAVRQDIAMLALYNAVSDNRQAYNLPFSFIDQFEDDTGTTTRTDVTNVSEYFATIYSSSTELAYSVGTQIGNLDGSAGNAFDGNEAVDATSSGAVDPTTGGKDWGVGNTKIIDRFWVNNVASSGFNVGGSTTTIKLQGSTDNFSSSTVDLYTTGSISDAPISNVEVTSGITTTTAYRYHRLHFSPIVTDSRIAEIKFWELATSASATGTLISDTQTSSVATTKMSGVILYKDNAGTATLGTDLKIYLSANGGSNYTEVSAGDFGAVTPLFSTGVKMVRLAEQTVTSGTTPVMKAVWANQASGSKETQLYGWAMNF